jgi:AcrR family transcriptional regulator
VSPRPRQASDEAILAAVLRAVTEVGPVRMTLADVAREAGISPAALVQRFGSKRALLLAFASQGADGSRFFFDGLRAAHRSPLAQLLGMADCMAQMGSTPEQISNTLAFLQIDLTDPDFHRFALQSSGQTYEGIRQLVASAIAAGELRRCPAARLARALQATMNGSLLNWAIHREGDLRAWIRRDLATVLAPWRQPRQPRARRSTARSRAGRSRASHTP